MNSLNIKSIIKRRFLDARVQLLVPKLALTLPSTSLVIEAINKMVEKKVGSIVLTSNLNANVGIFTERDVLIGFGKFGKGFLNKSVSDFMSSPIESHSSIGSIARAIFTMSDRGFRHLGVNLPNQQLGIISVKDILDFLYKVLTKKIVENEFSTYFDDNSVDLFFLSQIKSLVPKNCLWVSRNTTLEQTISKMNANKVGCVLVGEDNKLLEGIFTERDFLQVASEVSTTLDTVTVGACMTANPKTATANSSVALVMNMMCENGFRHIPVVDEYEKLMGILSVRDFFDYLASHILLELNQTP
jgi:CBS domain-containing protein